MFRRCTSIIVLVLLLYAVTAQANILATKHNLSSSSTNTFRSASEDRVCVFCHTPHNAKSTTALWNHNLSADTYTLYPGPALDPKSSLEATPTQPLNTSSTKLCLSCHDGTVAVGSYNGITHNSGDEPNLGVITGRTLIGTDLSKHHPVSIKLMAETDKPGSELVNPMFDQSSNSKLEADNVECASCHDPHKYSTNFLRTPTDNGQLCTECHRQTGWGESAHAMASTVNWGGKSVAAWGCLGCHTVHNAVDGTRLLRPSYNQDAITEEEIALENDPETGTCLNCHNGTILGVPDIRAEFYKTFKHGVVGDPVHYPKEFEDGSMSVAKHVECVDCHDSHRVKARTAVREIGSYVVGPELEGVVGLKGLAYGGAWTAPTATIGRLYAVEGDQESGLCLKCHGSQSAMSFDGHDYMKAIDIFFNPNNLATHGSIAPNEHRLPAGESYVWAGLVPELREKWDAPLIIACSDCHGNDDTSQNRVWGPHGSNWGQEYLNGVTPRWLLRTAEIPDTYKDGTGVPDTDPIVCYLCHDINVYGPRNMTMPQSQSNSASAPVPEDNKRSGFWFHGISQHYKGSKVKFPPGVPAISCFACHGDYSDLDQPLGGIHSGGLHGANFDRDDRTNSNTSPVHFLNGFAIEINTDDNQVLNNYGEVSCGDYDFLVDGVSVGCNKHNALKYTRQGVPQL